MAALALEAAVGPIHLGRPVISRSTAVSSAVRLGINYAGFGDWVLLGLEGDFDWSGASGSGCCSIIGGPQALLGANPTCQTRIDWLTRPTMPESALLLKRRCCCGAAQ
jgi:hypothetical protein